jgi:hypothetical protein
MSAERIAKLIPAEYRKEILELNMIDTAQALSTNTTMHYLAVVWANYIEKDFKADCNLCLARVLRNMQKMKPILVQLEKDSKLMKEASAENP